MFVSNGSSSIDCLNCSQKRANVYMSPENGSCLIGCKRIAADGAIGVTVAAASPELVNMTFVAEFDKRLSILCEVRKVARLPGSMYSSHFCRSASY